MPLLLKKKTVLPGFGLTLGFTVLYLSLLVLIPLAGLVIKTMGLTWDQFWTTVTRPQVVASYKLSFGAALVAALLNVVFGLLVAWVLVRYRFPGRKIVDALVDLPFALPTAVAGIALTALYGPEGWLGQWVAPGSWFGRHVVDGLLQPLFASLAQASWLPHSLNQAFDANGILGMHIFHKEGLGHGLKIVYTPLGVTIALTFISLPFVVRTVQPVLEDLGKEVEEAAASLGANRWAIFRRVIMPEVWPALLTGFALAFARAVGEYGSVVFISGNLPMKTEITPLLIIGQLEQYRYAEATAIAVVMLSVSFVLLLAINALQRWTTRRMAM
jgi:sulfate transport system permease protein